MERLTKSHKNQKFEMIPGTEGQVWSLKKFDDHLICGHNNGTFLIRNEKSVKLNDQRGGWTYFRAQGYEDKIIGGTYTGLLVFEEKNGNIRFSHSIKGFKESCMDIYQWDKNVLWVGHGYKGLFKLLLNEKLDSVVDAEVYLKNKGLPDQLPYYVLEMNGEMLISTVDGIYQYNPPTNTFIRSAHYNNFFENDLHYTHLYEDNEGNIWYFTTTKMGVYRLLEDGTYKNIYTPFLKFKNSLNTAFDNIYVYDDNNIFIGTKNGFIHYNPSINKKYQVRNQAYIRDIRLISRNEHEKMKIDSLNRQKTAENEANEFSYKYNSISFNFTANDLENAANIEYSCRLKGFKKEWTQWDSRNYKEYTNLHEGDYIFEVKAKNQYNNVTYTDEFSFTIKPPFTGQKPPLLFIYSSFWFCLISLMF